MNKYRLRILSYVVIAYILLAFSWWSIYLFHTNKDAYEAKVDLVNFKEEFLEVMANVGMVESTDLQPRMEEFEERKEQIENKYVSRAWMILGESIVFMIILLFGIYLIDRGYRKEVAAEKQRRNFLLSITHELKSPLASIRLAFETFLRRRLEHTSIEKLSQNGLKEVHRLSYLVNDLLLSARLEDAFQPNLQEIDVSLLANDLVNELEEKYPKAKFELVEKNTIPIIQADLSGMNSVLTNLLENAIKYSKDAPEIQMHLERQNGHLNIAVADHGIGIPDKEKRHIFDKFYRVGSEDTRKTKGTGLGLYIVNQIVKAHNGSIQVKDNEPAGTVMEIKLPLKNSHYSAAL